jgi:alanine dehydrogenase
LAAEAKRGPRFLDSREVDRLVEPEELMEQVAESLMAAEAPPRAVVTHSGSWFAAMPAAGGGFFVAKLVGVYPRNPRRGLPLVRGVLVVIDAETGETVLEADASAATGWRTAAATALALRSLGARRGSVVGIVGAGVQAEYHARVLRRLLEPGELLVYSRTRKRALGLALRHGGLVAESLVGLLRRSDVVVAVTSSTSPVVLGEHLAGGAIVASVGAPAPVRELDFSTLLRARCVVADTVEGVAEEAGDVDPSMVELVGLGELLAGRRRCIGGDVAVYKSVGTALLDHAIGVHLVRRLSS